MGLLTGRTPAFSSVHLVLWPGQAPLSPGGSTALAGPTWHPGCLSESPHGAGLQPRARLPRPLSTTANTASLQVAHVARMGLELAHTLPWMASLSAAHPCILSKSESSFRWEVSAGLACHLGEEGPGSSWAGGADGRVFLGGCPLPQHVSGEAGPARAGLSPELDRIHWTRGTALGCEGSQEGWCGL